MNNEAEDVWTYLSKSFAELDGKSIESLYSDVYERFKEIKKTHVTNISFSEEIRSRNGNFDVKWISLCVEDSLFQVIYTVFSTKLIVRFYTKSWNESPDWFGEFTDFESINEKLSEIIEQNNLCKMDDFVTYKITEEIRRDGAHIAYVEEYDWDIIKINEIDE